MEKSMKRKLPESEDNSGKTPTTTGEENAVAVKDAEVEEFFAILRRIHVATKYFQEEDDGAKRQLDKKRKRWRPSSIECKDLVEEDDDAVVRNGKNAVAKVVAEDNLLLDLNADPVTEDDL